jgi:hypothetical protein
VIESLAGVVARAKAKARGEQLERKEAEMAALREQLAAVEHHRDSLAHEIEAMRRSRFWKAREQWFRIKRAAGLTDEA